MYQRNQKNVSIVENGVDVDVAANKMYEVGLGSKSGHRILPRFNKDLVISWHLAFIYSRT